MSDTCTKHDTRRREFLAHALNQGVATSALAASGGVWAATGQGEASQGTPIPVRGYAAIDTSGKLVPWQFSRRPVGDHDILIEIRYASICHSDIHQMKGHWGPQRYPVVPGHEIVGVVTAVGKQVTRFKVGDRAGVGCMVDGGHDCGPAATPEEEQYCRDTVFTYGSPDPGSPTGVSQGGYSTHIVVRDHFAVQLPTTLSFEEAAPLLCAGITTYSPLMKAHIKPGMKVGVAGIGGLGHMAVKLAVSLGAEVYGFTTSAGKVPDILAFGARKAIVVGGPETLAPYQARLDYLISTIPYQYDLAAYVALVRPYGTFTQEGMPERFELAMNNLALSVSRVNFNASLIGSMKETQEMVNYCATHGVLPRIEVIQAGEINAAWEKVVNKAARYRYVIDAASFREGGPA